MRQPGHDQTFLEAEELFIQTARKFLDPMLYEVEAQPGELRDIFAATDGERAYGVVPEAVIVNRENGRRFFVEVKKQGPQGNAEERACKHHTVAFYRTLRNRFGYDYHPFVTVMCKDLATLRRYTVKFPYLFESDNYFLWVDYDSETLGGYLQARCKAWLEP